ncbi:MAG: methyltransferase domain-containing protein [Verrucomicrobiae bacterium]|nr:methyltransferase domain-containing protein [Verrucomicrobiae bacterium]
MNSSLPRLHLGAGRIIKPGWVNHDLVALPGIDVVHDLRVFPWPWADEAFDEIHMDNVLEHLPDTVRTMEELHRLLKPGGRLFLGVPYWNSFEAWGDPTHIRWFNEDTFTFFDVDHWRCKDRDYYSKARFRVEKVVYCINPAKPLLHHTRWYRLGRRVENRCAKAVLRFFATYFANVIHGLDLHLIKA